MKPHREIQRQLISTAIEIPKPNRIVIAGTLGLLGGVTVMAKKPSRGEPPQELIFFAVDGDSWQMEVDGSGKTALGIGYFGSGAEPSHETHDSERLFLTSGTGLSVAGRSGGCNLRRDHRCNPGHRPQLEAKTVPAVSTS